MGTGLKKCMPITSSGRDVAAASSVIGIDEVFEARIALSGQRRVGGAEELLLRLGVLDDRLDQQVGVAERVDRRDPRQHLAAVRAALLVQLAEAPLDRSRARARRRPGMSCSSTSRPDAATTCAMPAPIWPAPATRTRSKLTGRAYRGPRARPDDAGAAVSSTQERPRGSRARPRP